MLQPLPIDGVLDELVQTLGRARSLVLEAPPGTGKTTRVPLALLRAGLAGSGEVWVLEPRRIAARMAARRVAEEMGEEVGRTVGYRMRFEQAGGPETRIRFVTEGILGRRLLEDPELHGVGAVVLDEVHERHLSGDLGLALLRRLQRAARPDLVLCAMSATLDAVALAAFMGAPVLRAGGQMHAVDIEHLPRAHDGPLEDAVRGALARLLEETPGDALVFLPGAAEIRRCLEACSPLARRHDAALLPLHGSLPPAEQDRAVRASDGRKIVLSTNVAESSLTIDGVTIVVDSGLHRLAAHAPWSGLPTLRVAPISRASATQRAGRAGRTRPGRWLRLYTRGDLQARREHDVPEVARADLGETALELCAAGVADLASFPWFEAPPPAAMEAARVLLGRLGAVRDGADRDGRAMLRYPLHPRLSRALVEAERRGVARAGAALVAVVGERGVAAGGPRFAGGRGPRRDGPSADALDALQSYREAEEAGFDARRLQGFGVDVGRARAAQRVAAQLGRLARAPRGGAGGPRSPSFEEAPAPGDAAEERALRIALLAGFPDRVGRLRRPTTSTGRTGLEVVFAGGGAALLDDDAGGWDSDLVVAIDAEERSEGRHTRARVRLASSVHVDWLLELFFDEVRDETRISWNAGAERVEAHRVLAWGDLVLEESAAGSGDAAAVAARLAEQALARGIERFVDPEAFERGRARVAFVRRHAPETGLADIDSACLRAALQELCLGCSSFAELREADLAGALRNRLDGGQARALAELAPETVTLPGGRRARVDYAQDPPSVSSRLQDFFGMSEGPRVARGRVALVLHLLAPNQRAVQVTTDLAGFWARHYPGIARELRRRYPRHPWPDDPRTATPPAATGRR
ncbi:MAG: ATP-dependent helicase C-terminal domain-containing protein [Polyangiaceae bacterium]